MSVYDIKNIIVIEKAGGRSFMLKADEGFMIHLPEHSEYEYKPVVVLLRDYDFSKVQVVPESEVPPEPEDYYEEEVNNG